ncbi:bifunctional P-loop containing nucleoside triphosphate hydrolase/Translational (tr)-type GTP-binding domain [Babesia duncani]|uniref:Bifunctional P-loop containing nucleoside triphosphate hydrolase/Translational (Tr)-type GTP-binding domain n=1 Tax=Babesia duncani TaxID=323732 RepID=A0AAD9UNX5_9APIC|nr:bifunctional P-loop containing nucleoside triphosphate hydrolase/Translational (tr)-type GTP-binding domain [Babesia duncani]
MGSRKKGKSLIDPNWENDDFYMSDSDGYIVFEDSDKITPGPKPISQPLAPSEPVSQCVNSQQLENCCFPLNVVVCGLVDAGKSTMLGHLLSLTNSVKGRMTNQQNYAWILDQGNDERSRGLTIDATKCVIYHKYGDPQVELKINLIDTPGHEELKTNFLHGAIFAEVAVVVLDVRDMLESDRISQELQERLFSLYLLGIREYIICLNKIDLVQYNCESFILAKDNLMFNLRGYLDAHFEYIPICSTLGLNLVQHDFRLEYYHGPTLLRAFEQIHERRPLEPKLDIRRQNALYCHIFDLDGMGKNSKATVFVEMNLINPGSTLIALPGGVAVDCMGSNVDTIELPRTNGAIKRRYYVNDFVTDVLLKGATMEMLTGAHLLVDAYTYNRLKEDPVSRANSLWKVQRLFAFVMSSKFYKQGLCTGYDVELMVGYERMSASVIKVSHLMGDRRSLSYCIPPGDFGIVELQCTSPVFAYPVDASILKYRDLREIISPQLHPTKDLYIPILGRLLIKKGCSIIAGGIILRE